MPVVPNIVICGVRKCGTTALFRWLAEHPDVCASSAKESRVLMDRDNPYYDSEYGYHDHGIAGYERFFRHWQGEAFRMEATSRYYDQDTALDVLSGLDEPPHAVFLVRDPVDRLVSAFEYARNNRGTIRAEVTLEQFVEAATRGDVSELLAVSGNSRYAREVTTEISQLTKEVDYGCYTHRLLRWRERYPADRLHVLLFEDLRSRPRRFVQDLARRVGLDPTFYDTFEFKKENKTVRVRNHRLHGVMRRLAPFVPRNGLTRSAYKLYLRVQQKKAAPAEPSGARGQLCSYYASHNRELSKLFDLDLGAWPSA